MEIFGCDNPIVYDILQTKNTKNIKNMFQRGKLIAFDEAQTVPEIGLILKLLYDDMNSNIKIIATGSSSFDLSNKTGEPLTGRNLSYNLYPLSLGEIKEKTGWLSVREKLNDYIVYGTYPGIVDLNTKDKTKRLIQLSGDYLFKDILKFESLNLNYARILLSHM